MTLHEILNENRIRNYYAEQPFNPMTGEGAPLERVALTIPDFMIKTQYVPLPMMREPTVGYIRKHKTIRAAIESLNIKHPKDGGDEAEYRQAFGRINRELIRTRCRHDFCFWAVYFARIKNKEGGDDVPFILNRPQRRLLEKLERMRLEGRPIFLILLKARQWGGSTLVQMYMGWIQLIHKTGWNSIVVAHVRDASLEVSGMFSKLMENYPVWMLHKEGEPYDVKEVKMRPFEGANNIDIIPQRNCKIKIGTAEKPDSARAGDSSMTHCTEVAFWTKTENKTPEQIIRAACSGKLRVPYALEVYESTANGTGNFFHEEWLRAKEGESDKECLFVPWYEIEKYSIPLEDVEGFASDLILHKDDQSESSMGKYFWWLWEKGATLESINWYMQECRRYKDHNNMKAEYPTDDVEAFTHSGSKVFDNYKIEELRKTCEPPWQRGEICGQAEKGPEALSNVQFMQDEGGQGKMWVDVDREIRVSDRYLVIVDIGGRGDKADYSDILVIDRYWMMEGDKPEVVYEWHGHIRHDLLAWKAAQVALYYCNALLVIESNTLETKDKERDLDGNIAPYVLDIIAEHYDNLYARQASAEDIREGAPRKWGFHTNISTKPAIIMNLIQVIDEKAYVEKESAACDEMLTYEKKTNMVFGAIDGKKDDRVMTRAIGLYICFNELDLPRIIEERPPAKRKPVSAAII